MPFVKFKTSVKLDEAKRDAVRSAIWDSIVVIPGKTPEVTMIELEDCKDIRKGPTDAPALYIETRLFTAAPMGAKQEYAKKLFESLEDLLGIKQDKMYINIVEMSEWGSGGNYRAF